jgi:hypothetical protein
MNRIRNAVGLLVVGVAVVGAVAAFGPVPHAAAQMNDSGTTIFGPSIQGQVTQKFVTSGDSADDYMIEVNGQAQEVPQSFYDAVQVGDVVQYTDGLGWTIVNNSGA